MSEGKRIPLAAVIGHPITHSRSPDLHGFWLGRYNIKGHYIPMDVAPEDLETVVRTMSKMGFVGANVTIPHKEKMLEIADVVTDRAALIGAANTLIFLPDGRIHADNTDGVGFLANLVQRAPQWQPKAGPAAVLGAGGASRAIISALLGAGVPEIRLSNRTRHRAEVLRVAFGSKVVVYDWSEAGNMLKGCSTVVNTTSLGMEGQRELTVPLDHINDSMLVTDIVYTPLKTAFLAQAEAQGAMIVDGLGMLLHQAVPGFERWFGHHPEVDEETRQAILKK